MGMTAVLLTLMAGAGKVHDGTPGRDGTGNHQFGDEEEEGEEMGEDEAANDEEMHGGNVATRSQAARGRERVMEDQGGRRDTSARRNTYAEKEWREFEPKTARSFKKRDMPRIITENTGQPPSKKVIDSWITKAKLAMASEDLDWIVNLTNAMRKNADTDEYYIKHSTSRKLMLEEEAFDTSDKGKVFKLMKCLVYHKASAREYAMLRQGAKYSEDQAMQDFRELRRELANIIFHGDHG